MRLTWAQPEDLVPHELAQSTDEGKDVAAVVERWRAAGGATQPSVSGAGEVPATPAVRALARELLDVLDALPAAAHPDEPDEFGQIVAAADPAPWLSAPRGLPELHDRVLGAWTGRCVGCLLGKPVEKIPRQGIEAILRDTGRWPLQDYFTAVGLSDEVARRWPWNRRSAPTSLVENIDGMPEDDDLNFPILALDVLERRGRDFGTEDVAEAWLANLPAGRVFTAERAAYRNLLDARPVPTTATTHNPFREWIGALIRADVYGWVNPGDPLEAARMAWTDARLSHTRNGVYGAMWAAAACSAALVADDVGTVLDAALSVVPARSALAQAVRRGAELGASGAPLADALDSLHADYGRLHWVHVLNNAATVAYALAAGRGELGPSIGAAVTAGWDTDSAGATVGSVVGALRGAAALPAQWTGPVDGRVRSSLPGTGTLAVADLARRTLALVEAGR
ncbi:ADP-ribosylglycohydrolase family protein [Cellulomonas hominis]